MMHVLYASLAQELKQDGPVDSTVFLEDMTWDKGNYTPNTQD